MERKQILIADDEANLRRVLSAQLERDGYEVHAVPDGESALHLLGEHHIDVVITDLRMPRVDGLAVLKHVVKTCPEVPVIMITAHGTVDTAVEALKMGAFDYVTKPFEQAELRHVVDKAVRTRSLSPAGVSPDGSEHGRFRLIGEAAPMQEVYRILERVADTPSNVLITGESGTGKELIARALHENSSRRDKPFIRVNCAAIPPELIESELFGYEKGAFTGAVTSKPGRFELAHEGTLLLDEIGEIPVSMQVKLLRALQEQEFERVGGIKTIKVDTRLITATNRDLRADIASGRFREDLYYRLHVVHIDVPPLRDRRDDIPLLIEHFVSRFAERLERNVRGVDDAAVRALQNYSWPGNIRELENVIERCMLFCDGPLITEAHLPTEVLPGTGKGEGAERPLPSAGEVVAGGTDLKQAVRLATARVERELIARALEQTKGNVTHTARLLKISRKSLQTKMKELGLREE